MATITVIPEWTSLPQHLLFSIANLLHTRIDVLCFRAICRSFRSAVPPPPKLLFPPSILTKTDFLKGPNPNDDKLFDLVQSTIYAIQPLSNEPSQTWMVKVEETKSGGVQIKTQLNRFRSDNLFKQFPKSLNLLDYRVKEIIKSFALESPAFRKGKRKVYLSYHCKVFKPPVFAKVIFTWNLNERDDGFAVMAKYEHTKLGVWRNMDKEWSTIDLKLKQREYIEDIIYVNEKFYALVSTSLTIIVDPKSLTVTEVAVAGLQGIDKVPLFQYLVELNKDMFLVVQYEEENENYDNNIKVFKLNEGKHQWIPVVDGLELEDRVLFVAESGSNCVSAKEFSGCRGNCVYFVHENFMGIYDCPGDDTIIVDLKDGKVGNFSDFPGYSNIFWPPPSWLK